MKKFTLAVAATVLMASSVFAGDAAVGKGKSMMCAGCHGSAGISSVPAYPSLAGKKEADLFKQLKDIKAGTRNAPTMKGIVASLSDTDMANLAAYYASLK
jgi:cytochrome c553